MKDIKNPILIIPQDNVSVENKGGGGNSKPKFYIDKNNIGIHKNEIVKKIKTIGSNISAFINKTSDKNNFSINDNIYFKVDFNEKALAKSAQPKKIFENSNIDIIEHFGKNSFFAVTSANNFLSFSNKLESIDLNSDKDEKNLAFVSAIQDLDIISIVDIFENEDIETAIGKDVFMYLQNNVNQNDASLFLKTGFGDNFKLIVSDFGTNIIYGKLNKDIINKIKDSTLCNPIKKIEISKQVVIQQSTYKSMYNFEDVRFKDLDDDVVVGLIDSGVSQNDFLDNYIINPSNATYNESFRHGTLVASRIIFGHDIREQIANKLLEPKCKVFDIRIEELSDDKKLSDEQLIEYIKKAIESNKDIKVFNISLNTTDDYIVDYNDRKSFLTREIDSLSRSYDVIFIISSGNSKEHERALYYKEIDTEKQKEFLYPNCILKKESAISSPADTFNNLSVGSISHEESSISIARKDEPSPFSRSGLMSSLYKPNLSDFGGNVDKNNYPINVYGFGKKGFFTEDIGSSLSAPLVSCKCARVYSYLKKCFTEINACHLVNMTKALLIHSANYNLPNNSVIDKKDLYRLVGYGVPDFDSAINCLDDEVTFVYYGSLKNYVEGKSKKKENKNKIKFFVPSELSQNKKRIRIKATLVYTAKVQDGLEYSASNVSMSLKYKNSKESETDGQLTKCEESSRLKWYPIKTFEKEIDAYSGGDWYIWLDLLTRGAADNENYIENYALVVTIKDVSEGDDKINVYNIVKQNCTNYSSLQIKNKISNKSE